MAYLRFLRRRNSNDDYHSDHEDCRMMVYRLWLFEKCCNMDKHRHEDDNMIRDDTSLMDDDEAEEGRSCYDWPMVEDNCIEVVLASGILLLLYCYYYYRET